MKKRTTMLMSALFAAGAFALNGNVAKADNVQAVNNNNANSTEVKQNTVNADSSKLNVASAQANNQADTKIPSKEELKDIAMKQYHDAGGRNSIANVKVDVYPGVFDFPAQIYSKRPYIGDTPNWSQLEGQLSNAKTKVDTYLNDSVKNNSDIANSRNDAKAALEQLSAPSLSVNLDNSEKSKDKDLSSYIGKLNAIDGIWSTIENPYLETLISARHKINDSDYKNVENNYSDKLAILVAKNVRKDKNWVLNKTNPNIIDTGSLGYSPDPVERAHQYGDGEGYEAPKVPKDEVVLPWYVYNKDLVKLDNDAYNRNHGIKSDETTSDTKNQSTTDTKKDQSSQNVTDNTTSKKDQSNTNTSSSNTNQTTESNSSTTSDTKTPVAKKEGSNAKTTDVVKSENKATENTASVIKNDAKAATEKTTDVKVVAPAKNASNEVKTTDAVAKASDAHVVALNSKVNAGAASTTPAAATKGSQAKATESKLPQAGTDEKISLFASLAGLSIASLGLGALGASKKRKND